MRKQKRKFIPTLHFHICCQSAVYYLKYGVLVFIPPLWCTDYLPYDHLKAWFHMLAKETLSELLREVRENILKAGTIEREKTGGTGTGAVSFELWY